MFVKMTSDVRTPRGALSRDRVVQAAIALIDEAGFEALSARRLAERLGCKPMSLYNHVSSMDDLLDAIVDALLASALRAASQGDLAKSAAAYLALAERHPDAFILVATRVWRGEHALAAAAAFASHFIALGCCEKEAMRRARIIGAYLNGAGLALGAWKRSEASAPKAGNGKAVRKDLEAGLGAMLAMLTVSDK